MSKKLSIVTIGVGVLVCGICAFVYFTEARPGETPEAGFLILVLCGVMALSIGVLGLLGFFNRKDGKADGGSAGQPPPSHKSLAIIVTIVSFACSYFLVRKLVTWLSG
jgi:hypothetical protein